MTTTIPAEVYEAFGIMHLSTQVAQYGRRQAKARPAVTKAMLNVSKKSRVAAEKLVAEGRFEPKLPDDDGFDNWLSAEFIDLVDLDPRSKDLFDPDDFEVPPCFYLERQLSEVLGQMFVQAQSAQSLVPLVEAFSGSANPIAVIFGALFEAALAEVQAEYDRLVEQRASLLAAMIEEGCDTRMLLFPAFPRRRG